MAEHTPGPWEVYNWRSGDDWYLGVKPAHVKGKSTPSDICIVVTPAEASRRSEAECLANAMVLSASYDMLAALQKMVSEYETMHDAETLADPSFSEYVEARTAIAKAKSG